VVSPAIAVIFPPGRTVQVFAVAAAGAAAPALAIKAAVAASTTVPTPVRTGASLRRPVHQRYRSRQ
jgi:hypothetical protein